MFHLLFTGGSHVICTIVIGLRVLDPRPSRPALGHDGAAAAAVRRKRGLTCRVRRWNPRGSLSLQPGPQSRARASLSARQRSVASLPAAPPASLLGKPHAVASLRTALQACRRIGAARGGGRRGHVRHRGRRARGGPVDAARHVRGQPPAHAGASATAAAAATVAAVAPSSPRRIPVAQLASAPRRTASRTAAHAVSL